MLNQNLDIKELQRAYSANKRINIKNAFDVNVAYKVLISLENDIPWQLAYMEQGVPSLLSAKQLAGMTDDQLMEIYNRIIQQGALGFQFCYYHYSVTDENLVTCPDESYIYAFSEFLCSERFFELARSITGVTEIRNIEIQTARYTGGNYLLMHNDSQKPKRRVAFVLNLTREWHVDWGGLLHFISRDGQVTETFVPTFNSLTFFTVPVLHKVSYVMPFVKQSRYSVTGWLTI